MRHIIRTGFMLLPLLASVNVAKADEPAGFKFELHGIVGSSLYMQTGPTFLLNGQGPLLLTRENSTSGVTTGFDVRQSRLSFSVAGPEVHMFGTATPKAVMEEDFFGTNSPGGYGEVSALQRLRLAYVELNWGDTTARFGQDWELIFNGGPASLGHMAYPATYFAGLSGWREPGFAVYHKVPVGESAVQFAGQILKPDWENPLALGANSSNNLDVDAGQLSGWPGLEARVKWIEKNESTVYLAAHWNRVSGKAVAKEPYLGTVSSDSPLRNYANRDWDVTEAQIGGKWFLGDFTVQGDLYTGKNTAPLVGEQAVFSLTANDVHEAGGWLQVGYNLTPTLSLWGLYGTTRSSADDVRSAGGGRFSNSVAGGMLQYKNGGFGLGPEVYYVETKSTLPSGAGALDGVMEGVQIMMSGMYFF